MWFNPENYWHWLNLCGIDIVKYNSEKWKDRHIRKFCLMFDSLTGEPYNHFTYMDYVNFGIYTLQPIDIEKFKKDFHL